MPLIGHPLVNRTVHTAFKGQAVWALNICQVPASQALYRLSNLPDVGNILPRELLDCLSSQDKASPHADPQHSLRVEPILQVECHRALRGCLCWGNLHGTAADEGQLGSHQQGQCRASSRRACDVDCQSVKKSLMQVQQSCCQR